MRRCAQLLVGVESDIFMSKIKDKHFLDARLAALGKADAEPKHRPLSDDELRRFTTSIGSPESLFNSKVGATPTNIVDEATGCVIGGTAPDPTRFGDWEVNGRCYDF
jgi:hypothetical protein